MFVPLVGDAFRTCVVDLALAVCVEYEGAQVQMTVLAEVAVLPGLEGDDDRVVVPTRSHRCGFGFAEVPVHRQVVDVERCTRVIIPKDVEHISIP